MHTTNICSMFTYDLTTNQKDYKPIEQQVMEAKEILKIQEAIINSGYSNSIETNNDGTELNVEVYGSQGRLEDLRNELNSKYDLCISKYNIQEVGSNCLLKFSLDSY